METIKLGETWQYETFILLFSTTIVYPPPAPQPENVTMPEQIDKIFVPSGAGISIPEWYVEAPEVVEVLCPKYELI